jgi:hypothetical protein
VDSPAKSMLRHVLHSLWNEAEEMRPVSSFAFFRVCDAKIKPDGEKKGLQMDHLIRLKITMSPILIILSLASITLLPKMKAVSPPPDGGYANFNTAEGTNALKNLTTGAANTANGWFSLTSNTDGSFNTGVGAGTLVLNVGNQSTSDGVDNTAVGAVALFLNTTGSDNTAVGTAALLHNNNDNNTGVGAFALNSNTIGHSNTAVGFVSLFYSNNTDYNTAVGRAALGNSTGSGNTALGAFAGINVNTANNVIAIGHGGADVNNSCFIGNIRNVTTGSFDTIPVVIDSVGQLGTYASSARFKKEIKPMDQASEAILALRPVRFQYKNDTKGIPQFGLIAEEVAEVNPDLVVRDNSGEIYTVRYEAVNAMLLNEFLKEHRKVEEQQAAITELKSVVVQQQKEFQAAIAEQRKEMEAVVARFKEQDAQIQKVSAQIEVNKAIGQTALNTP